MGFAVLYLGLVFIVWGGWKTIKRQQAKLESFNSELEVMVRVKTAELNEAQDELVRTEKLAALGQVSRGIAHDLRNPLGGIKNAAYWLKTHVTDHGGIYAHPKLEQFLDIIDQQVDRSNDYITDLMNFASVKAPAFVETNLGELLKNTLATMEKKNDIKLSWDISSELHPAIVDVAQFQRVFLNLANNAQEAMPDGGELTLTASNVKNYVELEFIDTGAGISDENLGNIFDPLFTTKVQGTGLGLAVCHEIIKKHGGTISARRNERSSSGSVIEVNIPAILPT
jgi:signal transduction histidine kinase